MAKPKRQHQANASYWQTETNWMQLVLFGMQSRTARDGHLAAKQGIKFPGMGGTPKWREDAHGKTQTAHDKTQTGDQIPGDGWRTQTARGRPWQNPNSPWQNPDRGSNARGWVAHPNGERTPMAALARLVVAQTSCSESASTASDLGKPRSCRPARSAAWMQHGKTDLLPQPSPDPKPQHI
jgi:hypothetical protein